MSITIGPVHIADAIGTHEPGAVIETPSVALVELAEAGTVDPESGLAYAVQSPVASALMSVPTLTPASLPEPEPTEAPTPEEHA